MPVLNGDIAELSFSVTLRRVAVALAAVLVSFTAVKCGSEEYSISAYYPVPYGGFQRLQIQRNLFITTTASGSTAGGGPALLLTWPANQGLLYTTAHTPNYYNEGFILSNEGSSQPLRLMADSGTGAVITLSVTNSNQLNNRIRIAATEQYRFGHMEKFCYWYAATAATSGCLAHTAAGAAVQWTVMSLTRTSGVCDGSNISHVNTGGSTYCHMCCKLKVHYP